MTPTTFTYIWEAVAYCAAVAIRRGCDKVLMWIRMKLLRR